MIRLIGTVVSKVDNELREEKRHGRKDGVGY